ncbi:chymotrypsin A-like [Pararge aegeria]|uniref:Jg3984 protein n=1 Tax=Pararge aegeria aegeria TaxID=348720 RepID=A0A8S4S0Q0_9NEOP|nr:chymotrypsin A-like [Pararge aegeria]CAH2243198.1 jg3984 [Pararge aegeria aegeria]
MLLFLQIIIYSISHCESELRIYGGRDALRDEYPYVVRLEEQTDLYEDGKMETRFWPCCTGAALTPSWILSAAHCSVEEYYKKNAKTKLIARFNSYLPKYGGSIKPIFEVKIHPMYYYHELDAFEQLDFILKNDICLFRSEGILVNHYGKLSPLDYTSLMGHEAHTLGYGLTNATASQKPLQVLKGMIHNCLNEDQKLAYMLCLAPRCGVQTTICGGDSGGPIVHASGIVGVNSNSIGDCNEHSTSLDVSAGTAASVFATVSSNIDWISNIIANKSN